jgi:hypothetical protein
MSRHSWDRPDPLKSIIISKSNFTENGQEVYDLKVYEDKLMVHHMTFISPEYAEYYAENYMLKVWGNSQFSLIQTMQ